MTTPATTDKTINYVFLLAGLISTVLGLILLIRREQSLGLIGVFLGLWWLIKGAFLALSVAVDRSDVGWKLALGALGLIAGVATLANPVGATELLGSAFAVFLGVVGILIGIASIVGGFRGGGLGAWVFGIVSAVIGVLFIANPSFTLDALVTILALLLILDGLAGIWTGIRYGRAAA